MKYLTAIIFLLCAIPGFARELIIKYADSTFFYITVENKRTDWDLNLKTLDKALNTAHEGNTTCWRSLDSNTLVLYADVYDEMTMKHEHVAMRIICRGMFHVTIDRVIVNGRELFGHARDGVTTRLLDHAAKVPLTGSLPQDYRFPEPERGAMCHE